MGRIKVDLDVLREDLKATKAALKSSLETSAETPEECLASATEFHAAVISA
jgi:hypothetical protein